MSNSIIVEEKLTFKKYDAEWLKKFEGFEEYSDKKAENTINKLEEFAKILCEHLQNSS